MTHLIGTTAAETGSARSGLFRWAFYPIARRLAEAVVGRDPDATTPLQIDRARRALSGQTRDIDQPLGRAAALVERMDLVHGEAAEEAFVAGLVQQKRTLRVGFLNAHAVNLAWHDRAMARDFLDLDVLLRDGIGLERLLRRLNRDPGRNMNGTDLIPKILEATRGRAVAIYGTDDPWLGQAVERLEDDGHTVTDAEHGFLEDGAYAERFERSGAEIALLAMGMPKQERVSRGLTRCDRPGLILCGGAIVDFMAGRQARAPKWMRQNGLEWIFRLVQEPRRLFGRYIVGNVTFCARTALLPGRTPARMAVAFLDWVRAGGSSLPASSGLPALPKAAAARPLNAEL